MRIAVIGGGITGLTTAWYLKKKGFDVTIFEKMDRPGGVIHTITQNGFTFENGPNSGVLANPEVVELAEEMQDNCALEIADENAKFRWVWKKDRWHTLPSGIIGGISTPLFTFSDKLRLLGEPFRKSGSNPNESVASMVRRRMGNSFLRYAIDPFVIGIYSGDPELLVTRFAFPKLYNLEQKYGSFIGGSIKKAKETKTERDKKATRQIFSIYGGLSNLIDALVSKIGKESIVLNAQNIKVRKSETGFGLRHDGSENIHFDRVISTVGGPAISDIFDFLPVDILQSINKLQYARIVQVSSGFKEWEGIDLKAFGGLIPFHENRQVLGPLFISSFFKDRAPKSSTLISTFLGGIRKPEIFDLSDAQIIDIVSSEFKTLFRLKKWSPDLLVINRYKHAIPQYGIESEEKLEAIKEAEKLFPGLILAGNIRDGIGIADRVKQGRTIADGVKCCYVQNDISLSCENGQ